MRKTIKGKKGAISGGISAIFQTIGHFLSTVPPIVRWALFLIFLSIFLIVFNFFFGVFGYHCDTQGDLYKISPLALFTNIQLLTDQPDIDQIKEPTIGSTAQNNGISSLNCVIQNITGDFLFNGAYCTNCNTTTIEISGFNMDVCKGDVERITESKKSFLQKRLCWDDVPGLTQSCDIPTNFFFNQTVGRYQCKNLTVCGAITVGGLWNQKLAQKGTKLEQAPEGRAYTDAFSVQCNDEARAGFRLYSIPIFDYRLWMMITLLTAMLTIYFKIQN